MPERVDMGTQYQRIPFQEMENNKKQPAVRRQFITLTNAALEGEEAKKPRFENYPPIETLTAPSDYDPQEMFDEFFQ